MAYSALFFDFDGVLADSVEVKSDAFAKIFECYGPEIQEMVVDHHRINGGMTRRDKFRYYHDEFLKKSLSDGEIDLLCNRFSELVVDRVVASPEIPGAEDFLKRWYRETICFVVSATPDDEIVRIVDKRGLARYFKAVLGSSMTKQQNIEYLINQYALKEKECLFFGDAESDYRAAKACGMNFLGIVPGPDAPLLRSAPEVQWARNFIEFSVKSFRF